MEPLQIIDDFRLTAPPAACSYLPHESSSLEYRVISEISPYEYSELLRRGWRRHGRYFFRPQCPQCVKCRSLRLDVASFHATKSQRRALQRNSGIRMIVQSPTVTRAHVRLYNRYHADMHERRGWPGTPTDLSDYHQAFLAPQREFAREMLFWDADRLVGVSLIDVTPAALSSVYFFHDPDWRPMSPGTYSLLREIEYAESVGCRFVYLGYWIEECPSMQYKSRFRPHQLLERHVGDGEEPVWLPH